MIARFRYLWRWELFNALVAFPGLLVALRMNTQLAPIVYVATAAVSGLLLVGAAFAFIRCHDLRRGTQTMRRYVPVFVALRWGLPPVLMVILVMLYQARTTTETQLWYLAVGLTVAAVLEYINYFQVQLMYDNRADVQYLLAHRRLKRGLIARSMRARDGH
jgi:hypothetical protein